MNISFPFSYFLGLIRVAVVARMGRMLFWVENTAFTVLSCLSFLLMVSMILDWKHLDCYFFPGSNLDIQSFLSKEGENLASSREWWGLVIVPGHSWNWQLAWRSEMNAQWQQVGTRQIPCQLWKSVHSQYCVLAHTQHQNMHSIETDTWTESSPVGETRSSYSMVMFN